MRPQHHIIHTTLKRSVFRLLAIAALLFCTVMAFAQKPVQVNVSLIPPYSNRINDFYLGNSPKLRVMLVNHDLTRPGLEVRLKMSIRTTGNGTILQSNEYGNYPSLFLDPGVPVTVTMADLTPYFNVSNLSFVGMSMADYQKGFLKEGIYSFCFEAIEVNSRQSLSTEGCAQAPLSYDEPPLLNAPAKGTVVAQKEPTNLIFQWTPRHMSSGNAAFNTEYVFQLTELNDPNVNPQSAFDRGQPLFERVMDASAMLYGPAEPLLLVGRRYAWRVQVRQKTNSGDGQQFRNNGYSEVSFFDYQAPAAACGGVQRAQMSIYGNESYGFTWEAINGISNYIFEYDYLDRGFSKIVRENVEHSRWGHPVNGVSVNAYRIGVLCPATKQIIFTEWLYYGPSVVKTFTPEGGTPEPPKIKGRFLWAMDATSEAEALPGSSLLKPAVSSSENWVKSDTTAGKNRYAVPDEAVKVHLELVETTYTPVIRRPVAVVEVKDGYFEFPIPDTYRNRTVTFAVRAEGSGFNGAAKEQIFVSNGSDITLPNVVFTAKTTHLKAGVVCPDCPDPSKLSVDLLVEERIYESMPHLKSAGYGVGGEQVRQDEMFKSAQQSGFSFYSPHLANNYRNCVVIGSLKDDRLYKKLFNPINPTIGYWIRVRYGNAPARYYPLPYLYTEKPETRVIEQVVTYSVQSLRKLDGVVSFKNKPREGVRVKLTIPASSTEPVRSQDFTKEIITDWQGNYTFTELPEIRKNAPFSIQAMDATLREKPFVYNLEGDGQAQRSYNITLVNPVLSVIGQLVDEINGQPVPHAYITMDGQTVRSSAYGFYVLHVYDNAPKTVTVKQYSMREKTFTFTPRKFEYAGTTDYGWGEWSSLVDKTDIVKSHRDGGGQIWYYGLAASTSEMYDQHVPAKGDLKGVFNIGQTRMRHGTAKLTVKIKDNNQFVSGRIQLSDRLAYDVPATGTTVEIPVGTYYWTVSSPDRSSTDVFMPVQGFVQLFTDNEREIVVSPVLATKVSGRITDKAKNTPLADVSVNVFGLPYSTKTDRDGNYSFLVPRNEDLSFELFKDGYDQADTAFRFTGGTASFSHALVVRDPSLPNIKTIAGFPVNITGISKTTGANIYEVTGVMRFTDNKVFSVKSGSEAKPSVKFRKVLVKVGNDPQAAEPRAEIKFEEAVINMHAWGWAPVEVSGSGGIRLRAGGTRPDGEPDYSIGHIGGEKLILKLSKENKVAGIPIQLPDAELTLNNINVARLDSMNRFRYVFTTQPTGIVALSENAQFNMRFLSDTVSRNISNNGITRDTTKRDNRYLEAPVGLITSLFVARDSAMMNKDGINMLGYLKFPSIAGMSPGDSGKVRIDKFIIGADFSIKELNFRVNERNPYEVGVQKVKARLTNFIIKDLGTPNLSFGIGGAILLKRTDSTATKTPRTQPDTAKAVYDEALIIKEFSLTRSAEGNTVTADLKLGPKGIGIKGLRFTTPGESSIKMSYNNAEKSFEFDGSGLIEYKKDSTKAGGNSPGTDSAATTMFPIEIQRFQLRSTDWSMYLAAKANIKLNMKVASLNVEKIVVSVGSDVTMQEMNAYLIADSAKGQTGNHLQDANPDEPLDESKASWAIGVKGGFTFGIKGLKTDVAGSFLVGNVKDKMQFQVNEIALGIESSAFTLKAQVAMTFNDSCAGFAAAASLTVLKKEIDVKFGYYNLYKTATRESGMLLYAEVAVSAVITTGPITWQKIGGGFRYNSVDKEFMVKVMGDFGPTGTTPETMLVKDAFVSVLFQTEQCGPYPVVEGGGTMSMKGEDIAVATLKLDFCRLMALITVKSLKPVPIPMAPGLMGKFDGVFYATKRDIGTTIEPVIFLYAGVDLSSMGDLLKGNLYIALGINYNNADPEAPQVCRDMFPKISAKAKSGDLFHAIALGGEVMVNTRNSFDLKVGGFKVGHAGYFFDATGQALLVVTFSEPVGFTAGFKAELSFGADIQLLSFFAEAKVRIALGLEGGYADLREEQIRDKYDKLKNTGIDEFAISPFMMWQFGSKDRIDLARKKEKENGSTRAPNLYTDDYYDVWKAAYKPEFSVLDGAQVNIQSDEMYTEASKGKEFGFTLKSDKSTDMSRYRLKVEYSNYGRTETRVSVNNVAVGSIRTDAPTSGPLTYLTKEFSVERSSMATEMKVTFEVDPSAPYDVKNTTTVRRVTLEAWDNPAVSATKSGAPSDKEGAVDVSASNGNYARLNSKFSYRMDVTPLANRYSVRIRMLNFEGKEKSMKVFVNGGEIASINKDYGGSGFGEQTFGIPNKLIENQEGAARLRFQADASKSSYRVFKTTLLLDGKEVDWYMPHPNELQAYWESIEKLQKKATAKDQAVLSKRAINNGNWEEYRSQYNVFRSQLSGNQVGVWVVNDNRTYASAYAGGWYAFDMNTAGQKDLMLRVRYWGSDKNKAQTIFVNDQLLTRSTVNAEYPDMAYDVDYPIPNEFLAAGKIRVKYQADPGTAAPSVLRTLVIHDYAYYDKLMLEELAQMKNSTGPRSWYIKGFAEFNAMLAVNRYPYCNDYCMFCSNPGFKVCLDASGKFSWRKPDGQSADLQSEFKFGSDSRE
ncbi:MAG: carboxypeptidase-like regulatory domain-containing protein [Bacteroidota bacterium]